MILTMLTMVSVKNEVASSLPGKSEDWQTSQSLLCIKAVKVTMTRKRCTQPFGEKVDSAAKNSDFYFQNRHLCICHVCIHY